MTFPGAVFVEPAASEPGAWLPLSPFVREDRKVVASGSTVAYTRALEFEGRTFLVTHDHALVPKDRVRPYPRYSFHGVELDGEEALPIAFFREHGRSRYRRSSEGAFVKTGESWPRLGHVGLTGATARSGGETFLQTVEPGVYVLEDDATVVREQPVPPVVLAEGSTGRHTWIDISVLGGTLTAYEGATAVYVTLVSPGRGGVPVRGVDALKTAATPTGTFRVDGKFITATMVSSTDDLLVHTEVQYVQNFHGPHALHGAYWHDAWGEKKSGGCVNLSPIDAKRLFTWSEPALPEGWYGLRSTPDLGVATVIVIHD